MEGLPLGARGGMHPALLHEARGRAFLRVRQKRDERRAMDNFQSIIIHWKFAAVLCLLVLGSEVVAKNADLTLAKKRKKDEFYTQLVDIENELKHYKEHFKGKVVLCNCDDPRKSNFFKYFADNFEKLQLKRLIATCYKSQDVDLFSQGDCERAICQIYEGDKNGNMAVDDDEVCVKELKGDGDFRSEECIEILKQADVVVTNPPFSLFREYVAQLVKYGKKFLIIGNMNAITYKEIFPYIKEGKLWLGRTLFTGKMPYFKVSEKYPIGNERFEKWEDGLYKQVNSVCWFTNLTNTSNKEELIAIRTYNPTEYPKYDNTDGIEVGRMENFPMDYDGVCGIPITGLKYLWDDGTIHIEINGASNQFRIVKFRKGDDGKDLSVNGKCPYFRILIQKIK